MGSFDDSDIVHCGHEPQVVPRPTESAEKSDALQTLCAVWRRPAVAKRLECARLQRRFPKAGFDSMPGQFMENPLSFLRIIGTLNLPGPLTLTRNLTLTLLSVFRLRAGSRLRLRNLLPDSFGFRRSSFGFGNPVHGKARPARPCSLTFSLDTRGLRLDISFGCGGKPAVA